MKAIIFVKDRSVATYLKKILDYCFNNSDLHQALKNATNNQNNRWDGIMDDDDDDKFDGCPMNSQFRIGVAIGHHARSMANRAVKSLKAIENEIE